MTIQVPRIVAIIGVFVVAAILGAAATEGRQQAPHKLGYVNSALVLSGLPEYQQAESTYARELQSFQAEIERLATQLDSMTREYDQQQVVLTPSAKQQKIQEIRDQQQRFEQRRGELNVRAQEREQELLQPIKERMDAVLEGIRAEGNYAFIFDVAIGGGIVAADRSLEITELIRSRLIQGSQ